MINVFRKHVDINGTGNKFLVSKEHFDYLVNVDFDGNGADSISYTSKKYALGDTYEEFPTVSKSGYQLSGWYNNGTKYTTDDEVKFNVNDLKAEWIESKYTELEYVQFTGTQYINTNIIPTNHFTEVKYYVPTYINDGHILGIEAGSITYHFTEYSNKYYWGINDGEGNGGSWSSIQHILKYNYGSTYQVILDGTILGSNYAISNSSYPILIGRKSSTTNYQGYIYYFQITDKSTNTLVRDFIPVKDPDNVVCLYDKVTSTYFYNQGTGNFIAGPEK